MIKSVDILTPYFSQYNAQHHFTQKLYEALSRTSLRCRIIEFEEARKHLLLDPADFTISFNSAPTLQDGSLLCDYMEIPHVACLVDPSFHITSFLNNTHMLTTCDDQASAAFAKLLNPRIYFFPHAVERELSPDPTKEKIYDVVMLASFIDCEGRRKNWKNQYSPLIYGAMEETIKRSLTDESTSFIFAFLEELGKAFKNTTKDPMEDPGIIEAFKELEQYIKGRDRIDLIESVKSHKVHVFGNSGDELTWETYFKKNPNVIVHPSISFTEALEVMKQTKILLNSSIKNKHGAHERIFSGPACGAVVVTNDNSYMRELFVDGEEIVLFRRSEFNKVDKTINLLLNDENRRQAIAEAGRKKVMANHTWDHRVAQLLPQILPEIEKLQQT